MPVTFVMRMKNGTKMLYYGAEHTFHGFVSQFPSFDSYMPFVAPRQSVSGTPIDTVQSDDSFSKLQKKCSGIPLVHFLVSHEKSSDLGNVGTGNILIKLIDKPRWNTYTIVFSPCFS